MYELVVNSILIGLLAGLDIILCMAEFILRMRRNKK